MSDQPRMRPVKTGFPTQEKWFALINKFDGDEAKARAHVVAWLRAAADKAEAAGSGGYPDIFGCEVPERAPGSPCDRDGEFIEEFGVVLSQPWPG